MEKSFTEYLEKNISEIHELSARYNGKDRKHAEVLLELVKKHVKELEELYREKDEHFSVEAGDLMVLCLEMIREQGKDPDKVMNLCYGRYKNKLAKLINNA
ncbi:MAG: hypothetical protein HQ594_06020 [Candidatus Omnitrophica bacterium]|nr:hypothetical protein [Candidatus Omnitrophota bacterium]